MSKIPEANDPALKAIKLDDRTTVYVKKDKSEAEVRAAFANRRSGQWELGYFDTYSRLGNKLSIGPRRGPGF